MIEVRAESWKVVLRSVFSDIVLLQAYIYEEYESIPSIIADRFAMNDLMAEYGDLVDFI